MRNNNFLDYQKSIACLKYTSVPFTKVKSLKYDKDKPLTIGFKTSFCETSYGEGAILRKSLTRQCGPITTLPVPSRLKKKTVISTEKKKDIESMLEYMPLVDKQYYRALKLQVNP